MEISSPILAIIVAIIAGSISILAVSRPEVFIIGIERWVNYFIRRFPASYKLQEKSFEDHGKTRKAFALGIIRIGGIIGLIETVLLLFMLWSIVSAAA